MARSMMAHVNLSVLFWRDASLTAFYILNTVPSMFVLKTPYELWAGTKPSLGDLCPWGSLRHVLIPHLNKLECKTILCIFVR